jgi:hypothetical protein
MLIKKAADIASSEITPKSLYLSRRKFLAASRWDGRRDSLLLVSQSGQDQALGICDGAGSATGISRSSVADNSDEL